MAQLAKVHSSREEKTQEVVAAREKFQAAKIAVVTEYRGLTVVQMTRLRREIRQASGEYQVIKNTLARRALQETTYGSLGRFLEGPTGWVFGYDDPVALSKVLVKFVEENERLTIKGALLDGQFMDQANVKLLAKMPGRSELQAKLLAVMRAPAVQLVRFIQEPGARVVRLLETLRKGKSEKLNSES